MSLTPYYSPHRKLTTQQLVECNDCGDTETVDSASFWFVDESDIRIRRNGVVFGGTCPSCRPQSVLGFIRDALFPGCFDDVSDSVSDQDDDDSEDSDGDED